MEPDGLLSFTSQHGFAATLERLERASTQMGLALFARIDHAAAAASVGLALRPTVVLILGNPRAGTPLMEACPGIAIDLPLRVLVWEDDAGRVRMVTNDPAWLARRHAAALSEDPKVKAMRTGLEALLTAAGAGEDPDHAPDPG